MEEEQKEPMEGQSSEADEGSEKEFKVDEGWKESVAEERARIREKAKSEAKGEASAGAFPEPDFKVFMAGLYTQTMMALGELDADKGEDKTREVNLPEAEYLIDTIGMLREKTQGNLEKDERQYLDGLLNDLRMRFVSAVQKDQTGGSNQDKSDDE
ncbi:MAG: DUF1844 domain-containing protein [Candidatus Brocadiia bacterium]